MGAVAYVELFMLVILSLERIIVRLSKVLRKKTTHTQTIHVEEHSPYTEEDRVTTIDISEK